MVRKGQQLTNIFNDTIRDWLKLNGGDYLEIGSYYGVFMSELAEEFPNSIFYSIEPFVTNAYATEDKEKLQKEVKEYFIHNTESFKNITHWELTTKECLEKEYNKFLYDVSCVLVDGSHHYENICIDINFINNICTDREIMVIFDDLHVEDVLLAIKHFELIFNKRLKRKITYETVEEGNFIYFIIIP